MYKTSEVTSQESSGGAVPEATLIGGPVCHQRLPADLLPANPRALTDTETASLWELFAEIGRTWHNTNGDSIGLRSSWLEFVNLRAESRPSYVAEYVNAIEVFGELFDLYGPLAFEKLFFGSGVQPHLLSTSLAHAKVFVVDEFIKVQIVVGGFELFVRPTPPAEQPDFRINHRAYISGSRFNRILPVRPYKD